MDDREVLFCIGYQEILGTGKQYSGNVSPHIITMHESGLANTRETTCSEFHCKELNSAPKYGFPAFFNVVLFMKGKIEAPRRPQ